MKVEGVNVPETSVNTETVRKGFGFLLIVVALAALTADLLTVETLPLRAAELRVGLASFLAALGLLVAFSERGLLSLPLLVAGAIVLFVTFPVTNPPLLTFYHRDSQGVVEAGLLTVAFVFAFAVGFQMRPQFRRAARAVRGVIGDRPIPLRSWRGGFIALAAMAFGADLVFGWAFIGMPFGRAFHPRGTPMPNYPAGLGSLPFLPIHLYFPMVLIGVWYIRRFEVSTTEKVVVGSAVSAAILLNLLGGERNMSLVIVLGLAYIVGPHFLRRPLSLGNVFKIGGFVLALYYLVVVIGAFRNVKTVASIVESATDLQLIFRLFTYDTFDALMIVMDRVQSDGIMFGYSVYVLAVLPIPRMIWPGKPVGFGKVINNWVMGGGTTELQSFAPMVYGELYASFGLVAMLLLVILGANLLRSAEFELPRSTLGLLVWATLVANTPNLVRGDILSMGTFAALRVLGLVGAVRGVHALRSIVTLRGSASPADAGRGTVPTRP